MNRSNNKLLWSRSASSWLSCHQLCDQTTASVCRSRAGLISGSGRGRGRSLEPEPSPASLSSQSWTGLAGRYWPLQPVTGPRVRGEPGQHSVTDVLCRQCKHWPVITLCHAAWHVMTDCDMGVVSEASQVRADGSEARTWWTWCDVISPCSEAAPALLFSNVMMLWTSAAGQAAFRLQIINQNFPKFVKLAAVYGELNMVENIEDNISASPALCLAW